MAQKLKLTNVRLAFAHDLFTASAKGEGQDAKMKYGCAFLISPKDKQVEAITAAIDAAFKEKFGEKAAQVAKAARATEKAGLRDGDLKTYAGYEGNVYLSCSNAIRPLLIDKKRAPVAESDGVLYSGCYVNATVEIFAYSHPKGGNGISTTVTGVQFAGDGESFGGGGTAASVDEFDAIEGADAADDLG